MYNLFFKPILDFIFSLSLILLLSPLLILLSFIVYFKIGSPILFCQARPGKNEKIFNLYKFRSMTMECSEIGELLPDEKRITRFGSFLRSTSLDELPQLFNVLKGDISFIGPRPLLIEYLDLYDSDQRIRHNVKPGITGLAQVSGRNSITWEARFLLDIYYVKNVTFYLDLKIFLKTIIKVLNRSNVNNSDGLGMSKFTGTKE